MNTLRENIRSTEQIIDEEKIRKTLSEVFSGFNLMNKKLLIIIPDNSRSAPVGTFFKLFHQEYSGKVKKLDYLIALGTHPLLSPESILSRVGISAEEKNTLYRDVDIFNHRWDRKDNFVKIGSVEQDEMEALTGGLLKERVDVEINRAVFNYDLIIILGPVFPHEIAGFSGSNKYLFPGIGGWDFINLTHWLGALETNLKIIGKRDTTPRKLIDRAREMLSVPIVYFNLVVDKEGLKGLFTGDDKTAWEKAVELSSRLNIRYVSRPFRKVLSIPSTKYEDFWTGAKAFYKIEPMVEQGGEVVVYAPQIKDISLTHGKVINQIGFHVRDYFLSHMDRYKTFPRAVLAYSSLVKGSGCYSDGVETPRVRVVLSTGVREEDCRSLNMDYLDPDTVKISDWENREDEGVIVVRDAGEVLYRVSESD